MRFWRHAGTTAFMIAVLTQGTMAAQWQPTERITFVSHSSPGTGNDLMLREIAIIWQKHNLAPGAVVVENVIGSRAAKARRYVAQQNKGNAHMLLVLVPSTINLPILAKSDERISKLFTPIAILASDQAVLAVNAASPYRALKALIEAAKQKPKGVLQGGGNYGASASIMGRMLGDVAGVEFTYTPFKGGGEGVIQLLGSHVHFVIENPGELHQHVVAGKLRALAVTSPLELFPGVPTFEQVGYKFRVLEQFRGVVGPPGIGGDVAAFYISTLDRMRALPEWKSYLKKTGLKDSFLAGEKLRAYLEEEEKEYERVDRAMGLLN